LSRLEQELTALLHTASLNRYNPPSDCSPKLTDCIQKAVCNQNIIGWAKFLKGYISQYWITAQHTASSNVPVNEKQRWSSVISTFTLDLYKQIWEDRNTFIHGTTSAEAAKKLRHKVEKQVMHLYQHPPKLATRYPQITEISLETRLRRSTKDLQDWMARIRHQQKVSDFINSTLPPGQLTLQQAYARSNQLKCSRHHYPP
jgi:hypothetical protein